MLPGENISGQKASQNSGHDFNYVMVKDCKMVATLGSRKEGSFGKSTGKVLDRGLGFGKGYTNPRDTFQHH
jgi:hypothetical protein